MIVRTLPGMKGDNKLPLFRGTIVGNADAMHLLLEAWCPFCRESHQWAWPKLRGTKPLPVAGCRVSGPMNRYLIAPWRRNDPECRAHRIKPVKGIEL